MIIKFDDKNITSIQYIRLTKSGGKLFYVFYNETLNGNGGRWFEFIEFNQKIYWHAGLPLKKINKNVLRLIQKWLKMQAFI